MTPGPDKLWTGDWRSQSEAGRRAGPDRLPLAREAEATEAAETTEVPQVAPRPRAPRRRPQYARLAIAAGAAIVVIAAGAFGAGALINGDGGNTSLPAASTQVPKLSTGQTRAGAVYAAASPAVVSIRAGNGSGTGFLIDGDGHVVTNAHVVGSNDRVEVRFGSDGSSIQGEVRGTDESSDLAVVEIDPGKVPAGVKPLGLADSGGVEVGDLAIAIGSPFGLDRTATEGIVSGVGREIQAPNGFSIDSVIQTDAPINPGNSGGPLLDAAGRVIGVNSQIETAGAGGNVGIGFAVPSNTVRKVIPALTRGENIKRPYLGLATAPASGGSGSGAQVQSIVSGGPAERAGIRTGDVITRIDGRSVGEPSDVTQAISDDRPGKVVTVEVQRNGSTVTVDATLGTRPASTP